MTDLIAAPAAPPGDGAPLAYRGTPIRRRGAMLSLTDMWKAAGGPEDRRPGDWLALGETARFRAYVGARLAGAEAPEAPNAGRDGISSRPAGEEDDGVVAARRGRRGGTWAHWQLALSYARYLSPAFHAWANAVLRAVMEHPAASAALPADALLLHLERQFRRLHRRLDAVDRHAADLMFLQLSAQELLLGRRREFSERSRRLIRGAVAGEPYGGLCPCCGRAAVLDGGGRALPAAEYDHFFHRGLNRPEHGWLVCAGCHAELGGGGYLVRFTRVAEFRAFQGAVLERERREHRPPRAIDRPAPRPPRMPD